MKTTYIQKIIDFLFDKDYERPEFLITDCKKFIESLHIYNLKNLWQNIQDFLNYMLLLKQEYLSLTQDVNFFAQAQSTIQALFTLSCIEYTCGNKERIQIKESYHEFNLI